VKFLRLTALFILAAVLLSLPGSALAQSYYFQLSQETVNVYWNSDGTTSIDYVFVFNNQPGAADIAYVDVGTPNSNFDENSISADVNGNPVYDISTSGYEGSGSGFAVGLGSRAIPPGQSGKVHVFIGTVNGMLRPDTQDSSYTSADFAPNYFDSQFTVGTTDMSVTYHLPPGVKPDEPKWHSAPSGFPAQPATGLDSEGRVTYTWTNPNASPSKEYVFGASFPRSYVPASAVLQPTIWETLGIDPAVFFTFGIFCLVGLIFVLVIAASMRSARRRKLQYMPPKISIEGHGIKRGLTAIEAAILLEQPMDKILTMILFATIKKNAARVTKKDPLEIEALQPQPEDLQPYEVQFLQAFSKGKRSAQRSALQEMMVSLVKSVSGKMKGFSRRETVAYYKDIVQRAWSQVEAADTPEVKSQKFDEVMEWTMLDKDYGDRTRDVFRTGPVFVPMWWPRYDPGFGGGGARPISSAPSGGGGGGGGISLPSLPGGDFAAGLVLGAENFSSSVIGNLTDFTSGVTNKTNPVPVSSSSSSSWHGGGGGGCACACACAGCACACAGGGR